MIYEHIRNFVTFKRETDWYRHHSHVTAELVSLLPDLKKISGARKYPARRMYYCCWIYRSSNYYKNSNRRWKPVLARDYCDYNVGNHLKQNFEFACNVSQNNISTITVVCHLLTQHMANVNISELVGENCNQKVLVITQMLYTLWTILRIKTENSCS